MKLFVGVREEDGLIYDRIMVKDIDVRLFANEVYSEGDLDFWIEQVVYDEEGLFFCCKDIIVNDNVEDVIEDMLNNGWEVYGG